MVFDKDIKNIIPLSEHPDVRRIVCGYLVRKNPQKEDMSTALGKFVPPNELPNFWREIIECLDHGLLYLAFSHGLSSTDEKTMVHHLVRSCAQDNDVRSLSVMLYIMKSKGVNVNSQNEDGDTPLHICVKTLASKMADNVFYKILNLFGADATVKNKEGKTPPDLFRELPEY